MAKSKPKQQQWNEYLKNMTQEEKEFMQDTNRRIKSKFLNNGNPYANLYNKNERDYIYYFVLELKEDENLSFYYAGLALVRDTSNKFSYNGVCSALSDLKIIINNLSRKQNVTKEQQAFLDKWLPLIREAREKGVEEGVKDIEKHLYNDTTKQLANLMHKYFNLGYAFFDSKGELYTHIADVSPEEEEHIKKILEKEIFESLASDEVETPEAFVERLNRKYYLSSYKSTMQKAIEEKFFRYKIKIE